VAPPAPQLLLARFKAHAVDAAAVVVHLQRHARGIDRAGIGEPGHHGVGFDPGALLRGRRHGGE
jgi:hypothetical protein